MSQQPPFEQLFPSQQGWPGPPQVAHLPPVQTLPAVVQKRLPLVAFWQQFCPVPPQALPPAPHEPAVHAPKVPTQAVVVPMHEPLLQQLPAAAQVEFWQQVMPLPPQATVTALLQIEPLMLGTFWPGATHEPATQQPPPPQVLPGQQA